MIRSQPFHPRHGGTPDQSEARFGISAEEFPVARVDDTVFAMLPGHSGQYFLATCWCARRPLAELTRSDFYSHGGQLAGEAEFRAKVLEQAEHNREKRALGRREMRSRAYTPWGPSQGATVFAEGIICHSTAGHGGFHLSGARNASVDSRLRKKDGWYEEDAEWAIVAITFPHLFTGFERRCAEQTLKDSWPDAWEAIFGTVLQPGESREKDRRAFEALHRGDWVVVSAISSEHHDGFVEVVATLGGGRGEGIERRRFLVPAGEYEVGRFGFVVDPARHASYGGPSSFVAGGR
ncbi:DUF7007 domain-containing protein [Pannonibacter phragmitetus]|uniref:DUF7007 domain-containing protein n=1 Tax=Pannonibacter phragmitetus TaxID=121719 RepID=UPI000C5803FC|nr:hypothetical protein [Pannonibacter phragmitetus]MAZ85051.1 hypothetical protein [Hoeflea sp.]|tara:strand:+ start:2287 stop:3165 length:879 start_codon:yes stop_codon:yes gene_type:complete